MVGEDRVIMPGQSKAGPRRFSLSSLVLFLLLLFLRTHWSEVPMVTTAQLQPKWEAPSVIWYKNSPDFFQVKLLGSCYIFHCSSRCSGVIFTQVFLAWSTCRKGPAIGHSEMWFFSLSRFSWPASSCSLGKNNYPSTSSFDEFTRHTS